MQACRTVGEDIRDNSLAEVCHAPPVSDPSPDFLRRGDAVAYPHHPLDSAAFATRTQGISMEVHSDDAQRRDALS